MHICSFAMALPDVPSSTLASDSSFNTSIRKIGRKNIPALHVITRTQYHTIQNFGNPIPVQVTESLKYRGNASNTVGLSGDGWAWFVFGRRLLIWKAVGNQKRFGSVCKELSLPFSEVPHKATLAVVYAIGENQGVSCVAVSPEGIIRYWPNIANEDVLFEQDADLKGQECETVHVLYPLGFMLATTSGNILFVEISNIAVLRTLICKQLTSESGLLGGIGRRLSSFLFGAVSSAKVSIVKPVKIFSEKRTDNEDARSSFDSFNVYTLAGSRLQKWILESGENGKLLYECDLLPLVEQNFAQTVLSTVVVEDPINVKLMDGQLTADKESIMLLVSVRNSSVFSQRQYALMIIKIKKDEPPTKVDSFYLLKSSYFGNFTHDRGKMMFLLSGNSVYINNNKYIVCIPSIGGYEEADIIDWEDSTLLGVALVNNTPVYFSNNHGLVSLIPADSDGSITETTVNRSIFSQSVSRIAPDLENTGRLNVDIEQLTASKNSVAYLKAAFLYYVKNQIGQCKAIINKIFPLVSDPSSLSDTSLDRTAIQVSNDILNDVPAGDPRWKGTSNLNSTTSLQIPGQLNEKKETWNLYLSFLVDIGLWKRFTSVTWNDVTMATINVFQEHGDKLVVATTLLQLQTTYPEIIYEAIRETVKSRATSKDNRLTANDLFYQQVTKIEEGLVSVCAYCEQSVHGQYDAANIIKNTLDVNDILLVVFQEIKKYRESTASKFSIDESVISKFECELMPWYLVTNGLYNSLILQVNLTTKYGIRLAGNENTRGKLVSQASNLITIVLEGYELRLQWVKENIIKYSSIQASYEDDRKSLIHLLMEEKEYDETTKLAERFHDFEILIQLCETKDDKKKLADYMEKFAEQGFHQYLFSYYIREKKYGELLEKFKDNQTFKDQLSQFLERYPSLSWIHSVYMNDINKTSITLPMLAFQEDDSLRRKKSLLSMSKMAILASDDINHILLDRINNELDLIACHEDIPEDVIKAHGYNVDTLKVFPPEKLIEFYICEENTSESLQTDFVKALDLLSFVDDEQHRENLRQHIWYVALVRDGWPRVDYDSFMEESIFLEIVRATIDAGERLEQILDRLNTIVEDKKFQDLNDPQFEYFVRLAYERHVGSCKSLDEPREAIMFYSNNSQLINAEDVVLN